MTALGPIGALAVADAQTVRVFSFDATGAIGFAGTVTTIRVRVPAPLVAALDFAGTLRENLIFLRTTRTGLLTFAGFLGRMLRRAPLRFAKRKGIITRGVDR